MFSCHYLRNDYLTHGRNGLANPPASAPLRVWQERGTSTARLVSVLAWLAYVIPDFHPQATHAERGGARL